MKARASRAGASASAAACIEAETASDPVRALAQAVLYEGYLLWPYRRSALKSQARWTLGGVLPRAWCRESRTNDRWWLCSEVLLEAGEGASFELELRFLQVVRRCVARAGAAGPEFVDALAAGGRRVLAWDEARERELRVAALGADENRCVKIELAAGEEREPLLGDAGPEGLLVRDWQALRGCVRVRSRRVAPELVRVRVLVANDTPTALDAPRAEVLRRAFVSTHLVLRTDAGSFVSLTDPPQRLRARAAACRNVGLWPALVGPRAARDTLMCSPILLRDHPALAPERRGDPYEAGEVEQLLALPSLGAGEKEQRELAGSDARARALLERTLTRPAEALRGLHGSTRAPRVLVAGIGNVFLGDDGFGVVAVRLLAARPRARGVEVADFGIRGMDLVYALQGGYEGIVLVDAARRGASPGSLHVSEPELEGRAPSLPLGLGMDAVRALELARSLGARWSLVRIVGCEPASLPREDASPEELSLELSAAVRAALPAAVALVESVVAELLDELAPHGARTAGWSATGPRSSGSCA